MYLYQNYQMQKYHLGSLFIDIIFQNMIYDQYAHTSTRTTNAKVPSDKYKVRDKGGRATQSFRHFYPKFRLKGGEIIKNKLHQICCYSPPPHALFPLGLSSSPVCLRHPRFCANISIYIFQFLVIIIINISIYIFQFLVIITIYLPIDGKKSGR